MNTISSYIEYLETSWIFLVINRYAFPVKQQQIANKKAYCIDTGLAKSVAFSFSKDWGKFLENIVFLKLRRLYGGDIYYYKTKTEKEVDFYLPKKKTFIQVSQSIADPATRGRETQALLEAMGEVKASTGLIVTEDQKDTLSFDEIIIPVVPAYEWLLSEI